MASPAATELDLVCAFNLSSVPLYELGAPGFGALCSGWQCLLGNGSLDQDLALLLLMHTSKIKHVVCSSHACVGVCMRVPGHIGTCGGREVRDTLLLCLSLGTSVVGRGFPLNPDPPTQLG